MRKFFIDCGSHFYEGFKSIAAECKINKEWQCYSFEANPITFKQSRSERLNLQNKYNLKAFCKAVSTKSGTVKVNAVLGGEDLYENYTGVGSNILSDRPKEDIVYGGAFHYISQELSVESFSFSEFLEENINKEDYCLVKMDIEGSEFEVLEDIIESNSFLKISKIYVEFHERFFTDMDLYSKKIDEIKNKFLGSDIPFIDW